MDNKVNRRTFLKIALLPLIAVSGFYLGKEDCKKSLDGIAVKIWSEDKHVITLPPAAIGKTFTFENLDGKKWLIKQ